MPNCNNTQLDGTCAYFVVIDGKSEGLYSRTLQEAFAEYIGDALMKAGLIDDTDLQMIEDEL